MENNLQNKDGAKAKGVHIISLCKITTEAAHNLENALELVRLKREALIASKTATSELLRELWDEYTFLLAQLHKRYLSKQFYVENITTTVGRAVLAARLGGDTTYTGIVNYGAVGTGSTAPAIGNTTLATETYRKALSSGTHVNNITYLENFYTAAEVSGTLEEFGFFIDGTGTANSGQMFNRFTQSVAKSSVESLNVQSVITLSDA